MTRPRLIARHYDRWAFGTFARLARVLDATAQQHCPDWVVDVAAMRAAPIAGGTGVSGHIANTHKLETWRTLIHQAPDGARLALVDADVWICQPLDPVWERDFDLAYTVRRDWPIPFNLGVLFLRVSPAVRMFVDTWVVENRRIFMGGETTQEWRRRFGGVNQASFGALLERGGLDGLRVATLPCEEWNCEDTAWATFDVDRTRIVHVKSPFREMALGHRTPPPALRPLVARWRAIDQVVNDRQRRDA